MRGNMQVAYRGANYELGQGPLFYGIWAAGTNDEQPLEWWPKTPAGWSGAWARFVTIETPGTIGPVGQPVPGPVAATAATPAGTAVMSGAVGGPGAVGEPGAVGGPGPVGGPGTAGAPAPAAPPAQGPAASFSGPFDAAGAQPPASGGFLAGRPYAAPISPARSRIAGGLLAAGVGIGVVGLFPAYLARQSLAGQAYELVPHIIYLLAWAASAALIAMGGARLRAGALIGVGTSLVTFGLFFADAAEVMAHQTTAGPGLTLGLISWLACAGGSGLAFKLLRDDGPGRPDRREMVAVVTLIAAGLGAALAFAPSWDSYVLHSAFGANYTTTAGNAFANPAPVIVGDVAVMVAVAAVVAAAALWRPIRHGGMLVLGAAVPLAAQAISALLQVGVPTSPTEFVTPAQAAEYGITSVSNGLTPLFWVYCGFVVTLGLLAARMLIVHDLTGPRTYGAWQPGSAAQGWTLAGPAQRGSGAGTGVVATTVPTAPAGPAAASWPFFSEQQVQAASGQLPQASQAGHDNDVAGGPALDAGQAGAAAPQPAADEGDAGAPPPAI